MPRRAEQGFALATTVGLIVLFMLVAVGLSQVARLELKAAARQEDRLAAYYLARAGLARAQYDLSRLWAKGDPYSARADGSWRLWSSPAGEVRYSVQDEGGKLNINEVTVPVLTKALENLGLAGPRLVEVRDALMDWVDEDGIARQAGAEASWYAALPAPYLSRDGALVSPGELTLVKGVDPALAFGTGGGDPDSLEPAGEGLWSLFTIYKRGRRVDLNSAPMKVLNALPGLTPEKALRLVEGRRRFPFRGFQRVSRMLGQEKFRALVPWMTVAPGRVYTIISRARLKDRRARHAVLAVVRLEARRDAQVLFWVDDMVQSWQ